MPCAPDTSRPSAHEPCPWDIDTSCCDCWNDDQFTDADRDRATRLATSWLWRLTGRQFGCCCITIRPCGGSECGDGFVSTYRGSSGSAHELTVDGSALQPALIDGRWVNCGCDSCWCDDPCELVLPVTPVCEVTEVIIDGVVQPLAEFRVDNGRRLVWSNDRDECFPTCQHLGRELTEEGTFGVTYTWGNPVPFDGRVAAGELACEFLKACAGKDCQLPRRVQTIARQGINIQMVNDANYLADGLTGLSTVDQWIVSVNPYGLWERSRVYSVDKMRKNPRLFRD